MCFRYLVVRFGFLLILYGLVFGWVGGFVGLVYFSFIIL